MASVAQSAGLIHLGLDVHKDSISVAILRAEEASPDVEKIFHDEASVRRLIDRFPDRGALRVCYEAGPTGFGLHRLLASMGVACVVVAPSLIPKAPGDRVKTDMLTELR
jgi:transposase